MSASQKIDLMQTHFQVLGLDERATIVRRQIEEEYEKRATQTLQRLKKIDAASDEAAQLNARMAQLNAAKGVLLPRKERKAYQEQLARLREAERALDDEQGKAGKKGDDDGSAVMVLHLRQQLERARAELQKLHQQHHQRHAYDHDESARPEVDEAAPEVVEGEVRRRMRRMGEKAAGLGALAAGRPVKHAS